jgi:capsular exopolysaccharide synthesis family protein
LEKGLDVPVLASIASADTSAGADLINYDNLTSPLAESLRYLKVNLQFVASDRNRKVIGVTSTIQGEGKTFCALNLASIIAVSGSKTLVIGADIRKPKLFKRSQINNEVGLSSYLINQASLEEIIQHSDLEHLDVIPSGPVPPNPGELLELPKLKELFDKLRDRYEYIIVDTPPVGLVSDYLILAKYTDLSLYVVRRNYSKVDFIGEINSLKSQHKLANLYVIFNDDNLSAKKYGQYSGVYRTKYGYGYSRNGQYGKKKRFWEKYLIKNNYGE